MRHPALIAIVLTSACAAAPPASPSVESSTPSHSNAPPSTSSPAPTTSSSPPGAAPEPTSASPVWIDQASLVRSVEPNSGAFSFAGLSDGTIVAVASYADVAHPFQSFHGRDGTFVEGSAPWKCSASPADIAASGNEAWVHCVDEASPKGKPQIGFWLSADDGKSWARAGSLDGVIAMGSFAFGGGKLFLNGSVGGKAAPLFSVQKNVAKPATGKFDAPADPGIAVAASLDGSTVAVGAIASSKQGSELSLAASTDGGASIHQVWRGPWTADTFAWLTGEMSVVNGEAWLPIHESEGTVSGLAHVALDKAGEPARQKFKEPAKAACAYGKNVVATDGKTWSVSRDGGATFHAIKAPPSDAAGDHPTLQCDAAGVRIKTLTRSWD